ncbi:Uma2 family endonuclease [Streptomyces sp. NPDC089799]|uniref:Uma2 family endonuclease n=1 Tax=Streptomyces sp. NPDC089799 TaxID=3155066 RepID=UPI003440B3D0
MASLPDWMYPPRAEGWYAEDLDHLPEAPRHTELIDGSFVFRTPQRWWHSHVVTALTLGLGAQELPGVEIAREMTVTLDRRNRLEPDVLATTAAYDPDRTWFAPEEVLLVVEVASPDSAHRDTTVKLRKYAEAGIPHYWWVREEQGSPVVHVYELDAPAGAYGAAGIFRDVLKRPVPFGVELELSTLTP